MSLSLNQIVNRLRQLALSHHQINNFYFGDVHEFEANGEVSYPSCFCEQQPGTVDRINHMTRYNFRLYFCDLVSVAENTEGNETEVLSDMSRVAEDMLAMLMSPNYQDDWEISDTNTITPFTESLGDMVSGVVLDVTISVEFDADSCQVPSDEVEFEEAFDMARTKILTYEGTGTEGDSFTVSGLAGKTVLAVYRAGNYRRAITTTPTVSDKIKVTGTDLGNNKGILSSNGTVGLETGDSLVEGEVLDFLIWSV